MDAVGQKAGTLRIGAAAGSNGTLAVQSGWLEVTDALLVGPGGSGAVQPEGQGDALAVEVHVQHLDRHDVAGLHHVARVGHVAVGHGRDVDQTVLVDADVDDRADPRSEDDPEEVLSSGRWPTEVTRPTKVRWGRASTRRTVFCPGRTQATSR